MTESLCYGADLFIEAARNRKALRLALFLLQYCVHSSLVELMDDPEWMLISRFAGTTAPSDQTQQLTLRMLREMEEGINHAE